MFFWKPIFQTYRRQQLRCGRLIRDAGGELDAGAQIEIADLDRKQFHRIDAQNVLRLQIPVRNAFLVQKIQTGRNLFDDLGGFVFRKADVLLNTGQQLAAVDLMMDLKYTY